MDGIRIGMKKEVKKNNTYKRKNVDVRFINMIFCIKQKDLNEFNNDLENLIKKYGMEELSYIYRKKLK